MPTLRIDGRTLQVPDGTSLLAAARAGGIPVPTLCHHDGVEDSGNCRLCLVDVTKGERGEPRMVAACLYPAEDGLEVETATPRVVATRRVLVDLLLARCPQTPIVQRLAREHGIERTSYDAHPEPTDCVLCGLCTRVCDAIGVSAIASASRGAGRTIAPPFEEPPADCIGCLACAEVCPTGHIRHDEQGGTRTIWGRVFERQRCPRCGEPHVTVAHVAWAQEKGLPAGDVEVCAACKRRALAGTLAALEGAEEHVWA